MPIAPKVAFTPLRRRLCWCIRLLATVLAAAAVGGCMENSPADNAYLGSWRLQTTKGVHTILSLRNNGTFALDVRLEGRHTKIVEKRGAVAGTWAVGPDGKHFTLVVNQGDPAIGWPAGTRQYAVRQMDGERLLLETHTGKFLGWEKIRRSQTTSLDADTRTRLTFAPVVVNLAPSTTKADQPYKWLCAEIEIVLAPAASLPDVRPQWKEKALLLLNSKTYSQVNTNDKLAKVAGELRELLSPYMADQVTAVVFKNVIVTGKEAAVEQFTAAYGPPS